MLSSVISPIRLKFSEVEPIFKWGDKNDTSKYRPVSLLTSFPKIFEKVFCNGLYHHINNKFHSC